MEGRVGVLASMTGVRGLPSAGMNRSEKSPLELDLVNTSERTCFHPYFPTRPWFLLGAFFLFFFSFFVS